MTQYLSLLLVLTACGAPRAETKKVAAAEAPSQATENKQTGPVEETSEGGEEEYFNEDVSRKDGVISCT